MGEKAQSERPLIAAICQKEYDQMVLAAVQKELELWERLMHNFPRQTYEEIYAQLSIHRQKMVQLDVLTEKEFIQNWEQMEYVAKGFSAVFEIMHDITSKVRILMLYFFIHIF